MREMLRMEKSLLTAVDEKPLVDVHQCPRCNGKGIVEDPCNHLAFFKTCELCDGTGILKTEESKDE